MVRKCDYAEIGDPDCPSSLELDALAARLAEAERLLQEIYSNSSDRLLAKEIARFLTQGTTTETVRASE